jgi:cardiolipin synthase
VNVSVILPGTTDLPLVRLASEHRYASLLKQGIRLFEWTGRVLHAKTAVVDGRWATIGSSNLDTISLQVNLEANLVVEDEAFAQAVEEMFAEDLRQCREILPVWWSHRPPLLRLASWVAYRFRRWL